MWDGWESSIVRAGAPTSEWVDVGFRAGPVWLWERSVADLHTLPVLRERLVSERMFPNNTEI